MSDTTIQSIADVPREELYSLVWESPLSHLAPRFGVTGSVLARQCEKLSVPYPPPGYWSKRQVGKTVPIPPLPTMAPAPELPLPVARRSSLAQAPSASKPVFATGAKPAAVPRPPPPEPELDALTALHPKVRAWLADHAQEQKKRIQENKRRAGEAWAWTPPLLADLTPRDLYRFRATSTLIRAAEKAGARIESALLIGDLTFKVQQDDIVVRLVEKMHKPLVMPKDEAGAWTAYPNHHQSGLMGTGFLRVAITTYMPNAKSEWLETKTRRIDVLIPEIAAAIVAAGPRLIAWRAALEEQRQEFQRREQERYELQRKREQEERRWQFFRASAVDWKDKQRLDEFITELEHRLAAEGDGMIEGQLLSAWLAWARDRSAGLDPFSEGVSGFFARLVQR
jgi:hypothetical protein